MNDRAIEFLFEQFRSRGDVAALGAVFDRTAPELFRVAQHLAGDVHAAEDALQAAFLTAIEHAHTWDASRPLLPWLLGILANRVRELRRARRAPDPARVAAETHADPEADAHARELAAAVESTLTDLPNPYRDVLTRHLRDGRTPAEIASELGRAPGTVRVQLSRGFELVRRALPPSFALAGAALASAGRGHAAVRADVLARAAERVPRAPTEFATSASLVSLPAKLAVTCAAVAVALAAYFFPSSAAFEPQVVAEARARDAEHAPPADVAANDVELATRRTPAADELRATAAHRTEPGIWIVGRVFGAEGIDLARLAIEASTPQLAPHEPVPVEPDGSFAIDVTRIVQEDEAPATCRVALTLVTQELVAGHAEVLLSPELTRQPRDVRSTVRCDMSVVTISGLRGAVTGLDAHKGAIVVLYARTADGDLDPRFVSSRSTEDSAFELRTRATGHMRLLVTAPPLAPLTRDVQLAPGRWTDVGALSLASVGVDLAGTVQLPPGMSVPGWTISAERSYDREPDARFGRVALFGDRAETATQHAQVAADGTFRITGLAPGAYDLELSAPNEIDWLAGAVATNVIAPAEGLALSSFVHTFVVNLEHDGRPIRADVEWTIGAEACTARTSIRGRKTFVVAADDDVTLVAGTAAAHSDTVHVPARGRAFETVVLLDPAEHTAPSGALVLEPVPATEAPRRVHVTLTPRANTQSRPVELDLSLDGGTYATSQLAPGDYTAAVEPSDELDGVFFASFAHYPTLDIVIVDGRTTRHVLPSSLGGRIRVRCAGDVTPGSVAAFVIRDARGGEHALRSVFRSTDDEVFWDRSNNRGLPLDRECELFPNLPAGDYTIELTDGPFARVFAPVTVRENAVTTVPLTLAPR